MPTLMEELMRSRGLMEPSGLSPSGTTGGSVATESPATTTTPTGQRPIDVVAQDMGLTPFQVWQQLQGQTGDAQTLIQQRAQQIQSGGGGLGSGTPTGPVTGSAPDPQTTNPPAGQPGGAPTGGPSDPGVPEGIAAWEAWHNKPFPGPGGSDPATFGGGSGGGVGPIGSPGTPAENPIPSDPVTGNPLSSPPGQGPLGGPRGTGTEGDPLFGPGTGGGGVPELAGGREGGFQFRTTPGFNFRMALNQQALENSAAARGGLLSGNTLKDLSRFSQGLAEEEFGNVFNMLGALRGGGATRRVSGAAQNLGANVGNLLNQQGQAGAQGILGANQATTSGIGGAAGFLSNIDFGSLFGGGDSGGGSSGGNLPRGFGS